MNTRPPFFVIGSPRSGTTLLRNLLRSHPNLAVSPESHFVPILYRAVGEPTDERSRRRLIARVLSTHWVRAWRISATPEDFEGCSTFSEIIDRLYRLHAGEKGHCRQGDKTPGYAREIPTLERIFPGAQYIHIIRDGRDVALSLSHVWFGHRHVYTAARYWRNHVISGRRDGAPLGDRRYLEIRYETLLQRPEETMRQVCAFLGEPFDPRVLTITPTPPRPPRRPNRVRSVRMVSTSEIVPSNSEKWRTAMSRRDLEIFETAAGDLLDELGYERVTRGRAISPIRRLYWVVDEFFHRVGGYWSRRDKRAWLGSELRLAWFRLRRRPGLSSRAPLSES